MQVPGLLDHLERITQGLRAWREAHCHRLNGVDTLAHATRPIRIAKRDARRDELSTRGRDGAVRAGGVMAALERRCSGMSSAC